MSKSTREAYRKRTVNTYRASREEVLNALGIHVPHDAGVSWTCNGNVLEVIVERIERKTDQVVS